MTMGVQRLKGCCVLHVCVLASSAASLLPMLQTVRDNPQLAQLLIAQDPSFGVDPVTAAGQPCAWKCHLETKVLAGISVGGSRETFCEVATIAPDSDRSGVATKLAVGLSSSAHVRWAVMVPTMRDALRDSAALAVAMASDDGADHEYTRGVLYKATPPTSGTPAWAQKLLTPTKAPPRRPPGQP